MKTTRLAEDLIPVNEFRTNLASWLNRPAETGRPLVVTQRGKAAAVVVSPSMLDEIAERGELVQQVLRGLREVAAGEVVDDGEVWAEVEELLARYEDIETTRGT